MEQTEVEVKLLKYAFRFKKLHWREEFAIKFPLNSNPQRIVLAHALLSVSGIIPKTPEEAIRVLDAVPIAIVERVYRIWKGTFGASRRFTASRLYKAPEPLQYEKEIEHSLPEDSESSLHDRAVEAKYGSEQLRESKEIQKKILEGARKREGGYRGAVPASNRDGTL